VVITGEALGVRYTNLLECVECGRFEEFHQQISIVDRKQVDGEISQIIDEGLALNNQSFSSFASMFFDATASPQ